jgi:hypothetical protein
MRGICRRDASAKIGRNSPRNEKKCMRQFATTAGLKKKDESDDKLVRNIASAVNGQIRSSYESLVSKNNSMSITIDARGQDEDK